MKFQKYQDQIAKVILRSLIGGGFFIAEEAGEVCKVFKQVVDNTKALDIEALKDELGDVLAAVATTCNAAGLVMDDIAAESVEKWTKRKDDESK